MITKHRMIGTRDVDFKQDTRVQSYCINLAQCMWLPSK